MEGVVVKEYKIVVEANGKKGASTLRAYPDTAIKEFWLAAKSQAEKIEGSYYGQDMEFCKPTEVSVSLLDADGSEIVGVTYRFGR